MTKTWICLRCKRSGDKITREGALVDHGNQQMADAQMNARMARIYPGFSGPTTNCVADIRMKPVTRVVSGPVPENGVLGGDDPWI